MDKFYIKHFFWSKASIDNHDEQYAIKWLLGEDKLFNKPKSDL